MADRNEDKKEDTSIRIVLIGDYYVGKTNFIDRYMTGIYKDSPVHIGPRYITHTISVENEGKKTPLKVHMFDTPGQERYTATNLMCYRGADGIVILFDITKKRSFANVESLYMDLIKKHAPVDVTMILIGCKSDLEERRQVDTHTAKEFAGNNNMEYFEVSAVSGYNVEKAFFSMAMKIINNREQKKIKASQAEPSTVPVLEKPSVLPGQAKPVGLSGQEEPSVFSGQEEPSVLSGLWNIFSKKKESEKKTKAVVKTVDKFELIGENEMYHAQTEIHHTGEDVSDLVNQLKMKNGTIETLEKEIRSLKSEKEKNEEDYKTETETLQQRAQENKQVLEHKIYMLEQTISGRERAISELQENEKVLEIKIHQLEQTISTGERTISEIEENRQTFENRIHLLEQTVSRRERTISELQETISKRERTIGEQQQQIRSYQDNPHWAIKKNELLLSEEVLGRGGWGEVRVGTFRGTRVAIKSLYDLVISSYNLEVFAREMDIASRVRHPNLLLFIGATREGKLLIVTELMPTSLRKEIENHSLKPKDQAVPIGIDVATALSYLHYFKPHPILHRDVSSANVLLEPTGSHGEWKAKLSDYGSANLQDKISVTTAPGSPVYAAPEALTPSQHSPAMDIYSFGVLLLEMVTERLPSTKASDREAETLALKWTEMKTLIECLTDRNPKSRPNTENVIKILKSL